MCAKGCLGQFKVRRWTVTFPSEPVFTAGVLSQVDVYVWQGGGYTWADGGAVAAESECGGVLGVVEACSGLPPIAGSQSELRDADGNEVSIDPDAFLDVAVNAGAVAGAGSEFSSIHIRTGADIALGTFVNIGSWSAASSSGN